MGLEECVFCKIVRMELPAYRVYEDKGFLAFLDVRPLNPGHTLVIPKLHYRWVWDVPDEGKYFETVKKIAKGLQKSMKTEWVVADIAGTGIPHAHVHLVPRFPRDGHGEFVNPQNIKEIPEQQMNKIAEDVRKNI